MNEWTNERKPKTDEQQTNERVKNVHMKHEVGRKSGKSAETRRIQQKSK